MPFLEVRPKGIVADIAPSEVGLDAWTSGRNLQFRNGFGWKSQGWEAIFPECPGNKIQHLFNQPWQGINYWFALCDNGIWRTDTSSWVDVTPTTFTGTIVANKWTADSLNGVPVFNCDNDIDVPWYHDFSDNGTKPLPDWPINTTVAALRAYKFHLFGLDVTENSINIPNKLIWSDSAAPGSVPASWTPEPGNDAGSAELSDIDGPLIDASKLRSQFYVYGTRACVQVNYIAGTFVFGFRNLFTTVGLLAKNCALEFQGRAYLIADGDVYTHDGQNFQSIVWGRAQRRIFDQIDGSGFRASYVVADRAHNEIYFCFAPVGKDEPNIAVTYSVNTDSIGVRLLADPASHIASGIVSVVGEDDTWDGAPDGAEPWDTWNKIWNEDQYNPSEDGLLMASGKGVFELDATVAADGVPVEFYAAKMEMDFDSPQEYKLVKRVWPRMSAEGTDSDIVVRVGASANDGSPTRWGPSLPFNPTDQNWVDVFANGRFISIEFQAPGGSPFFLEGFDLEYEMEGRF